jgi:hypothetical protein
VEHLGELAKSGKTLGVRSFYIQTNQSTRAEEREKH